ncbi:MAG: ATP-binding cassette domain-containing protein, partial [Candidatus Krumholzibacteria bacterium]|nr:ATP-binding cassette domain-containing protein [Candidatus Krumholzibacteria bacterium]
TFNLLPRTTALQNVELPLIYRGAGGRERRRQTVEALELVGLEDRIHHRPNELSGGEQQRVAVARALMNSPAIVLADEPSGNLDDRNSEGLHSLIWRLSRSKKQTFVIVTHKKELLGKADRCLLLQDGKLREMEGEGNALSGL